MKLLPTIEALRYVFVYDPETGVLTWRHGRGCKIKAGAVAGTRKPRGFFDVRLDGLSMKVHRVVWAMHHGAWPTATIDHINTDCGDNRIANLREASMQLQNENARHAQRNNRLGVLGVFPSRTGRRFCARIQVRGRNVHLGTFATPDAAHQAYVAAKRSLHEGCTL